MTTTFSTMHQVPASCHQGPNGNKTLEIIMKLFSSRSVGNQSPHHLQYLKKALGDKKQEFDALLKKFSSENRCFSEDAQVSVAHQTVIKLFKTSLVNDENISEEALRCLGEIGPLNLSTFLLTPPPDSLESDASPTICVIRSLVNYLLEDSVETSNASAQALKHILYTTKAQQDLEKFERSLSMKEGVWAHQISLLMHPFKNAMTKGVYDYNAIAVKGESEEPEAINLEEFLSNVDDDQVWPLTHKLIFSVSFL